MLLQPGFHRHPFPYFSADPAFSGEQCGLLEKLFREDLAWQHQDGTFYRCALGEVTGLIPEVFQLDIIARMRELTGLPLSRRLHVTAQVMTPGQAIGVHSDRPLLGYETARLILQLNENWQPEDGGLLELFASQEGRAVISIAPEYNSALGFVLHAASWHAVTKVSRPRRTVVFNFWHEANTAELATHVEALFAGLHFSQLPAALDPYASAAEQSLPEELTYLAGTAAIALQRWGYDTATVVAGYQYSAGLAGSDTGDAETTAAVLLADWVAFLYRETFDLTRWESLRVSLSGKERFVRLRPIWQLCVPDSPDEAPRGLQAMPA